MLKRSTAIVVNFMLQAAARRLGVVRQLAMIRCKRNKRSCQMHTVWVAMQIP